jgi:hypothetical protein
VIDANRMTVIRCGRRWGKTDLDKSNAVETAIAGYPVGWFAPEYKFISEAYNELSDILEPVIVQSSKTEGVMRLLTGGRVDFWSLENERAGRSRKYKLAVIDEAAFTKPNMADVWQKSIRPTLLDLGGKCVVTSNTNGIEPNNFLYQICHDEKYGFAQFHATTADNPYMPAAEVAKLQADNHPLVYQQEYLAEFVDWSGAAFFSQDSLLVDKRPVPAPPTCSAVFAVIDSAVKTGKANDGTGVVYFAYVAYGAAYKLVILDYDVQQIEGALLETWLPTVFDNLEAFAKSCRAIKGSVGVWIEDKSSGMILLQQAQRRGKNVHAIDSKLTSVGKDERAISVSGYVYQGLVKLATGAFERVVGYKGTTRNHLLGQVVGFRVGDKDAAKRQDDLLDCFTYGIALALGDAGGF